MKIVIFLCLLFCIIIESDASKDNTDMSLITLEETDTDILNSIYDVAISKKHNLIVIADQKSKKIWYYDLKGKVKTSFYINYYYTDSCVFSNYSKKESLKTSSISGS